MQTFSFGFPHTLTAPCCPQKKMSFEPTTSHLLKNLKPFSTYTFQLAAKSKHGIGAYTNEVSMDTPQTRRSNCTWCCVRVCVCVRGSERERGFNCDNAKMTTDAKNTKEPQTNVIQHFCIVTKGAIMNPDFN